MIMTRRVYTRNPGTELGSRPQTQATDPVVVDLCTANMGAGTSVNRGKSRPHGGETIGQMWDRFQRDRGDVQQNTPPGPELQTSSQIFQCILFPGCRLARMASVSHYPSEQATN